MGITALYNVEPLPETPVAETGVESEAGELRGKLLLVHRLQLGHMQRGIQHSYTNMFLLFTI